MFSDFSIKIFIIEGYTKQFLGFIDMRNSTATWRNIYDNNDVIKIPYSDWSIQIFICIV